MNVTNLLVSIRLIPTKPKKDTGQRPTTVGIKVGKETRQRSVADD